MASLMILWDNRFEEWGGARFYQNWLKQNWEQILWIFLFSAKTVFDTFLFLFFKIGESVILLLCHMKLVSIKIFEKDLHKFVLGNYSNLYFYKYLPQAYA